MLAPLRSLVACATLATMLAPLSASAAEDTAMSHKDLPCSKAALAMSGTMHSDAMKGEAMHGDAMHGDAMKGEAMAAERVDAAYASAMAAHAKAMMDMAKLEMRCGTDAKAKASAERSLPDLQRLLTTLSIF